MVWPITTGLRAVKGTYLGDTRSLGLEEQSQSEGMSFNDGYDTRRRRALGRLTPYLETDRSFWSTRS